MKKHYLLLLLWIVVLASYSCTQEKTEIKAEEPPVKEDFSSRFEGFPLRVTEAYKISGNDSLNLLSDTIIQQYRDAVCLTFREGSVYFYGSTRSTNTKFPPQAQTFSLNIRIMLPTNMNYHWDAEKETVIVNTSGLSNYFPIIPDGKQAYIDTTGNVFYKSLEEARDAVKPAQIRFIYDDVDPKLGPVKYAITLRPLWFYERDPINQAYQHFVMF